MKSFMKRFIIFISLYLLVFFTIVFFSYVHAEESYVKAEEEWTITKFDKLINAIPDGPLLAAAHYSKGDSFIEMEKWKFAGKSYLESFRC